MKVRFEKTVSMRSASNPLPASQRQSGPVEVPITEIAGVDAGEEGVVVINLKNGSRILADLSGVSAIPVVQD